ncbi:MAG: hypothetical protein CSA33_01915 [Desulfobulbus propionicus]|nr:MAG: hypothetical protein CSA33_01915 [Desulfobulbus propionicus]
MYSSLADALVNTELTLVKILDIGLAQELRRLGLFVQGQLVRLDSEFSYHPVRVRGHKGDMVVPAGLAIKIYVHIDNTEERKPLVEMNRQESGHIESLACGMGCVNALKEMGIVVGEQIVFIRALPHMDYIVLINGKERTRLSEGEAARIWGKASGAEPTQLYFARRREPFEVLNIIGGKKARFHLQTHGVEPGYTLLLEAIEPAGELHKPDTEPIVVSSPGGLRLYLNPQQAEKIIVKAMSPESIPLVQGTEEKIDS